MADKGRGSHREAARLRLAAAPSRATRLPHAEAAVTLDAASAGFQTFAQGGVISSGALVRYTISDGNNWEIGAGTYSSSGPTLARTTILESSNSGSPISLSGAAVVMVDVSASDLAQPPGLYGSVMSVPPTASSAGFTNLLNPSTSDLATFDVAGYGFGVTSTGISGTGDVLRGAYAGLPYSGGVYTITMLVSYNGGPQGVGFWSVANNKGVLIGLDISGSSPFVRYTQWNPNFSSDTNEGFTFVSTPLWYRLQDDGTNFILKWSKDKIAWVTPFKVAKGSIYTGDTASVPCLGFDNGGAVFVMSYEIVNAVL